ncbi:hypothetical protein MACH24_22820 [Erythrobacter sp. Dej080120_24]|uniref:hypothetical protein n=1 Tax=Erythrobacter sp. Dej080120_24 TaxID=3024837 RepID=UPI00291EB2D8|nr:hypothetical protein MACH24_22820 [Erythrobacter sp. Dej080120_24]
MTRRTDPRTTRLPVPARELPAFTPVPRRCVRHDGWTPERQQAFIEALADTGSVAAACRTVNMSAEGAYYLRRQPGAESFRTAWQSALDLGVQRLEDVAMERALNGIDVPVYSYGALIGTRKSYNDRLLMFLLRNRAPERFGKHGSDLKGLNAVGKMEKARLKKKWRKEWEGEQRQTSPAEVRASIDAKVERVRTAVEAEKAAHFVRLSPETRRAFALYERLRARDEARLAGEEDAAGLVSRLRKEG